MSDIVIIGGGIAGLSAAAALAPHGRVTLLEGEARTGYHASGRSAAMFEPGYGNATIRALNAASRPHLQAAGVLCPRGVMVIGGPDETEAFLGTISGEMEELSPAQACAMVPILRQSAIARAALSHAACDIDTDRLMQAFARAARASGARIVTAQPVRAITRAHRGWRIEAGETHTAALVVNAAGAWADDVAAMAGLAPLGITPYRRSMARVSAPGGHDVTRWPMLLGAGERWYAKPDAGKWLISPAEEDPSLPMDAYSDDLVLAEGIARYEAFVTTPVTRLETSWAGLRSFAPDRHLVIGPDPRARDFLWCAGQGGYGFQTAPAAARLLADISQGRAPEIASDIVKTLLPDRLLT